MRPPTGNIITQGVHGMYNGVDYSYKPDPVFYAPEDITFYWYGDSGDCGNNLQVTGAHGTHGFCHLEESYIKPGETKKKGEALGKMGYTGKTIPVGPEGRHLHHVIKTPGGNYIYPPSLETEPFKGGEVQNVNYDALARRVLTLGLFLIVEGNDPDRQPTQKEVQDAIDGLQKDPVAYIDYLVNTTPWLDSWNKSKHYNEDVKQAGVALDKLNEIKKIIKD